MKIGKQTIINLFVYFVCVITRGMGKTKLAIHATKVQLGSPNWQHQLKIRHSVPIVWHDAINQNSIKSKQVNLWKTTVLCTRRNSLRWLWWRNKSICHRKSFNKSTIKFNMCFDRIGNDCDREAAYNYRSRSDRRDGEERATNQFEVHKFLLSFSHFPRRTIHPNWTLSQFRLTV